MEAPHCRSSTVLKFLLSQGIGPDEGSYHANFFPLFDFGPARRPQDFSWAHFRGVGRVTSEWEPRSHTAPFLGIDITRAGRRTSRQSRSWFGPRPRAPARNSKASTPAIPRGGTRTSRSGTRGPRIQDQVRGIEDDRTEDRGTGPGIGPSRRGLDQRPLFTARRTSFLLILPCTNIRPQIKIASLL